MKPHGPKVTDLEVCTAFALYQRDLGPWPNEILARETGEPEKVCYRAMERASRKGLINYGVSLRSGWLTPEGWEFLSKHGTTSPMFKILNDSRNP